MKRFVAFICLIAMLSNVAFAAGSVKEIVFDNYLFYAVFDSPYTANQPFSHARNLGNGVLCACLDGEVALGAAYLAEIAR